MKKWTIGAVTALFVASCGAPKPGFNPEVTLDELRASVGYLASDSLSGRFPGTAGDSLSAAFISQHFHQVGLKPLGDSYSQDFEVFTGVELGQANHLRWGDSTLAAGTDFVPLVFSANAEAKGTAAFVGYGYALASDSLKWDDFAGQDLTGKWAVILLGDPEPAARESQFIPYSEPRAKVLNAQDRGAIGVIFVAGPANEADDQLPEPKLDRGSTAQAAIPVLRISRTAFERMTGKNVEELEAGLNENKKPASFAIDQNIEARASIVFHKVTTHNLIGVLEAPNPAAEKPYLVVCAHYDHLGMGGPGSGSRAVDTIAIHNGADDNASGVAAMIEMAQALAAQRDSLQRNIIFMAFGAEEMGLLGSKFFTSNPTVSLDQVMAVFNFDMVGRLKEDKTIAVSGTGTAAEHESILDSFKGQQGLDFVYSQEGYGPSDHASFYVEDIPVLFFSTGAHEDYHTPQDDADRINYQGIKTITDLGAALVSHYAQLPNGLTFQEAGPKTSMNSRSRMKVTFGVMPAYASQEPGLTLDGVTPGKPAALAGIRKGDRIVAIDGKPINDIYEYMARLQTLEAGSRVSVDVVREGETLVFIIEL